MKPYFLLLAITYCYWCNAACKLSKLPLDNRTNNSKNIIEGEVISQRSCWNADQSSIYTVNTVLVNSRLKGSAIPATVEVITPGGELDGRLLVIEPNAELKVGSAGVFFLKENTHALNHASALPKFEIYALAQGFIEQDKLTGSYRDPFDEYNNQSLLYSLIGATPTATYRLGDDNAAAILGGAAISMFTPATINAGTQSVLTIYGSGFGTRSGQATVKFRDANSTSSTTFTAIPDTSYILSWEDTEIRVIVPGASANRQGGAGTGVIQVIDANGAVVSSNSPLNITYNQFEYRTKKVSYYSQNGNGGYTFTLSSAFNGNIDAKNAFTRAFEQWKCKTGINISINNSTTSSSCSNQMDNINVVSFATTECQLPAGTLGVTYSSYSVCSNTIVPDGIDMIFNPNVSYYYGTAATPGNQYDFESIVLHELGHAFGEGHNSSTAEIMFPSIGYGVQKRTLNPHSDLANVTQIVDRSIVTTSCGYAKHSKLNTSCMALPAADLVTASFISDKIRGCAPLTVNFTDKSLGNPTQWRWDIDNNGNTDYTTQHPSHTYNTPGTYTVKLVAKNAANTDSTIVTAQIVVAPALNANIDILQQVSCNGGNNGSLKALPTGGNGVYTYTWNTTATAQTLNNASAGQYTVTVKDGYNCSVIKSGNITQPDPINVSVNITKQLTNSNLHAAVLNTTGGVAPYRFILNDATEYTTATINNLNPGNYALKVKDQNNCIKTTSFAVESPTSINETEKSFDLLEVYPNPAIGNLNVNFTLKEYKSVQLELFDLTGKIVFADSYSNIKDQQASIDLSYLNSGTYLLRFNLPEGSTFRKIVVNR
jgi:PKD repeat protein